MGWWASADGRGVIGDRPADIAGRVLTESLGDRVGVELFQGFLGAVGAALARNPRELLADTFDPEHMVFAVEYDGLPTAHVPVLPPVIQTALDDAVYAALGDIAFEYRVSQDRAPQLAEVLETVAFAARTHLDGATVVRISARDGEEAHPLRAVVRSLLTAEPPLPLGGVLLLARALDDADWVARMTAVLVVGRLGIADLARPVGGVEVPPVGRGVREDDRRALLALRDVAAARAAGFSLERPVHPDPEVAEARAALLGAAEAAVAGTALPGPQSRAFILQALADPEAVATRAAPPAEWRAWLDG